MAQISFLYPPSYVNHVPLDFSVDLNKLLG